MRFLISLMVLLPQLLYAQYNSPYFALGQDEKGIIQTIECKGEINILRNGGKLVVRTGTEFTVPSGGLVNMDHGEIIRSGDFFPL